MFRGLSEGDYIMPDNSNLRLRQQIDEIKKYRLDCELEIKNKGVELSSLRNAHNILTQNYSNVQIENDRLKKELEFKEEFKSEMIKKDQINTNSILMVKRFVNELQERIEKYEEMNQFYLEDNDKKRTKIKALEDWFNENLDKKTNLIDEEIKKGNLQLIKHEQDMSNLELDKTKLKSEIADLLDEIKSKNLNINEMCAEILKNTEIIEELKNSLDLSVKKTLEHETSISLEKIKVAELNKMVNTIQLNEASLRKQLEESALKNCGLIGDKELLEIEILKLNQVILNLKADFEKSSVDVLAMHMIEMTSQSNEYSVKLETQKSEFEIENKNASKKIIELELLLRASEESYLGQQDANKVMQASLKKLEAKVKSLENDLESVVSRKIELVKDFKNELDASNIKITEQNVSIARMQSNVTQLEFQLQEKLEMIKEISDRDLMLSEKVAKLNKKIELESDIKKVLESELKRKATQVKIKDETIDELKIQLSEYNRQEIDLKVKIADLKDEIGKRTNEYKINYASALHKKEEEIKKYTDKLDHQKKRLDQADLEVVNLTEILNSKKFGKKSTRHFSTQTDCQKETVAAIQTDAQKKQAIPCLSNLIEENQVATKTSRIRRDTYRGKRLKLENLQSEEEEEEKNKHKMVKKIAGPVKAVKENYTIRTIQKENSISTDEKVLEFNESFLNRIGNLKDSGGLIYQRSKRKAFVSTSTPVNPSQSSSQLTSIKLSAIKPLNDTNK